MLHDENNIEETVTNQTTAHTEEVSFKEQYLRLQADFQNYKRRVEKERIEWMQSAQVMVLEKLLTIFDELDRAIVLSEKQPDATPQSVLEGFKLLQKNWHKALMGLGVEEIPTHGKFDPMLHEALMNEVAPEKESGDIVTVLSKGYKLREKVIQHAKVSVAQ